MNLNDLWIGDKIRIISSQKIGIFEGINSAGKARIRYNRKILLVSSNNIEVIDDSEPDNTLSFIEEIEKNNVSAVHNSFDSKTEIDLHIEKLNAGLINAHPEMIIDYQLKICQAFIEYALSHNQKFITIIHGKGKGVLKSEVIHLLNNYPEFRFSIDVNNGGGQEVYFK